MAHFNTPQYIIRKCVCAHRLKSILQKKNSTLLCLGNRQQVVHASICQCRRCCCMGKNLERRRVGYKISSQGACASKGLTGSREWHTFSPCWLDRMRCNNVVFPAPRKPESTVTGSCLLIPVLGSNRVSQEPQRTLAPHKY